MKRRFVIIIIIMCVRYVAMSDGIFQFALVTDTHISRNTLAIDDLENTVLSINHNSNCDFVLVSGDLTEGGDKMSLMKVKQALDRLQVPYFVVPGNHETKWSESGATDFRQIFGSERFCFEYGDFFFLGFNSGPIIRMMDGHVGTQDINWLKGELEKIGKEKKVIIVTHYPLQNGDVDNWYEVTDLIRQYNIKAILSGHYHRNELTTYDGIPAFINRSNLRGKDDVGGYSIYTVTEDSIIVSEQRINQPVLKWGGYSLNKSYYNSATSDYLRPDFSVNSQYPEIKEKWIVKNEAAIYSSPIIYKNKVYVADDLGFLSCYSLKSGELQWQFQSGSRLLGTPAADKNIVVFGSTDQYIYGINAATGKLKWKVKTGAAVFGAVTVEKGKAFIGGSDHSFRCIDITNGNIIWSFNDVGAYVETLPLIYRNKVIFGVWDSYLYALNKADGSLAWKWNNGNTRMHFSPAAVWPVGANERVYFSAPDRYLTALNVETGETVWRTKESMVRETIGLSEDKKRLFSKTMQDSVVCFSTLTESPDKIWSSNVGYGYDHAPSMLVEKDKVIFGSTKNGLIFALNSFNGKVLWIHKTGNSLINTVVPINSNECVFTSAEGYVGILVNKKSNRIK